MKKIKHVLLVALTAVVLISCQTEDVAEIQQESSIDAITTASNNASREIIRDIYFWKHDYKLNPSSNTCYPKVNYTCASFLNWWGEIEYHAVAPAVENSDSNSGSGGIVLEEGTYTSSMKCAIFESYLEIEILAYSDSSMYNENEWKYTIPEDGYLTFGESYSIAEGIESVKLLAGEYEIIPSENGTSVGTVIINAEVNLF